LYVKSLSFRCFAACGLVGAGLLFGGAGRAAAQDLAIRPLVFADGRVAIGGDVTVTVSCADTPGRCGDDTGFFNYSDYEHSALRSLQLDLNASVSASSHLAILAELRSENGSVPTAYALYARVRPWASKPFDIRAGRVPPTFGAFARRSYANDNILIGYPLAYQYLTSLRPDAVPRDADELLSMRGRGWLSQFSLGNTALDRGLPLATAFRWDTGIQLHTKQTWGEATGAVTTGSLGNPLVSDDNAGKQVAGRVAVHPVAGLVLGASGARGPFLSREAVNGANAVRGTYTQAAIGFDVEYSRDYYIVRFEAIRSTWTIPTIIPGLRAMAVSTEGRYKVHPRVYVAARYDHLGFSRLEGALRTATWEAPVTRVEVGGGYLVTRNLLLKTSGQVNRRDGGRVTRVNLWAGQLAFWF
jgi:hypothetical protein